MSAEDLHQDDVSHNVTRLLRRLADDGGDQGLTLREIRDRMDERAYGLLILLLSIPCLVPGLYGVPQVVGVIIILIAAQLLVGREEPWLPRWMLDLRAKGSWLKAMADFAESKLAWVDRLSRPRLSRFATGAGEKLAAIFMILATLSGMCGLILDTVVRGRREVRRLVYLAFRAPSDYALKD